MEPFFGWDIANSRFDLKVQFPKTYMKFYNKICQKKVSRRIPSKFKAVESMPRWIYLPRFVTIGWRILTLLWGQCKMCPTSVAWWPCPKDTKMGIKIFSHTQRLIMCDLKKLASGVFPESWKVLAEQWQRRQWRQQRKWTKNSPPLTQGDLKMANIMGWLQWVILKFDHIMIGSHCIMQ